MRKENMTDPQAATGIEGTNAIQADAESSSQPSAASRIVKIVMGLAALAVLIYFGRQAGDYFQDFATWVQEKGLLGVLVFIAAYAVGTVAFIPGAILTMAAGIIYGLFKGTLVVVFGATLGATSSFLVARYLARAWVQKTIDGYPKFATLDKAISREGRKIVFFLRLTPVFPFSVGNYMLGLTRVRLLDYVLACLGMIPGTFLYVYYGKAIGDIAALASGNTQIEKGTESWIFLGIGLAATIAVTAVVTRIARKALQEATEASDG